MTLIDALSDAQLDLLADRLAGRVGDRLQYRVRIWGDPDRLATGANVNLVNTLFNTVSGSISLGDHVFFGHDCLVLTGSHDASLYGKERQTAYPSFGRDIVIEEGAWICSGVIILGPCRIGRHAVIGAGSVVLGDVPAGWLYAGSPARPIREVVVANAD